MRKLIDFKLETPIIQQYADKHCEGNFNLAVRTLCKKALGCDVAATSGKITGDAHLQSDLLTGSK